MHRFRKKSDVKRNQASGFLPSSPEADPGDFLPPVSDFRTSLILPDLSRRFSLLRTPTGDPVTIDHLRTKFAEQRARGVDQTISEEEEDMLLETLGRIRARTSGIQTPAQSQESINGSDVALGEDESGSNSSTTIKLTKGALNAASSTSRSNKRYSNNLFGSGRLKDYAYLRSVASSRTSAAGSSKTLSLSPSETSSSTPRGNTSSIADSLRPSTPTGTGISLDESVQSSPASNINDQDPTQSSSSLGDDQLQSISAAESRLQQTLGLTGLKRASMALEHALKEIEDDVEEEIVMPRSTPIPRNHFDHQYHQGQQQQQQQRQISDTFVRDSDYSTFNSVVVEAGMAISPDKPTDASDTGARRGPSPVPLNVTPGYIPGMPRPMTPRDFESFADEQRSHSTTPRATSPMHASFTMAESAAASVGISNILKRDSATSSPARQSSRPTTPLFLQRSTHSHGGSGTSPTNGRFTPVDERNRSLTDSSSNGFSGANTSPEFDSPLSSSILSGRRRPASPLASPPFQPMSAVASTSSSNTASVSRPTTPSNIVWVVDSGDIGNNKFGKTPASPASTTDGPAEHSRDNSWASEGGINSSSEYTFASNSAFLSGDVFGKVGLGIGDLGFGGEKHSNNGVKNSKPYTLPDSPMSLSTSPNTATRSISPLNGSVGQQATSNVERMNSSSRVHRSSTPTQNAPRSPTSPTFGSYDGPSSRSPKRSSRQNGPSSSSPFNLGPLTLNPRANLSSSSLGSAGSSFHSWEGEKDKVLSVFTDVDAQPAWHDFSTPSSGKSSTSTSALLADGSVSTANTTSPEDDWDPEEIIKGYAGLKKCDFAVIQEKLVGVAKATENRGSTVRKRRPSTSQSNYSVRDNRVASPPPASPVVHVSSSSREQQQIRVLNTCLDEEGALPPPALALAPSLSSSSSDKDNISASRPNRNLTQVLFGQDEEKKESPSLSASLSSSTTNSTTKPEGSISISTASTASPPQNPLSNATPSSSASNSNSQSSNTQPAYLLNRNPSTTRIPPQDQVALAREVQQKVEAATLALRHEGLSYAPSLSRKRIDPSQISKPHLVSASTSVDTIPLRTPSLTATGSSGASKIGSRFKRLRGSLRAKNTTAGEDNASHHSDTKVSPNAQTANYDHEKLKASNGPGPSSANESGRFKVSIPTPPASAGPGLKGFMARFRTKRMTEIPQASSAFSDHHSSPKIPSSSPLSPPSQQRYPSSSVLPQSPSSRVHSDSGDTSTTLRPEHHQPQPSNILSLPSHQGETSTEAKIGDSDALQQLFAAANRIGIDQNALNDLVARSGSITRTVFPRGATAANSIPEGASSGASFGDSRLQVPSMQPNLSSSSGSDHTATPAMFNSSPISDAPSNQGLPSPYNEEVTVAEGSLARKLSSKKPDHLRRRKDVDTDVNPIVRRTLIFVDPRQSTVDPALTKKLSMKRRRISTQSASNRSIHDRVPTPPPSKTPQAKRFSHDAFPPVPQIPHALGGPADQLLSVPTSSSGAAADKSNSAAYDSLYELYGDSRAPSMMVDPNNPESYGKGDQNPESATGVELIELANGETIWKIVNGLRDEDDESLYTGRNSVGSEYSTREGSENMQVFVKEHVRTGSKGSNASFLSRKKTNGGKPRPDTKVLYSSPEHIGRLIENLSQGMDAGSFSFLPFQGHPQGQGPSHSATSSLSTGDITWTMNEIDHMLTTMNRS